MINKYPDGSSYATINHSAIREFPIVYRVNSYEQLWELNQFVDAYNNLHRLPPTILIPCLFDAQADRRFNEGESSGLKLVCKFLNKMNARFRIYHPHNPEVVEALIDDVVIMDNALFIQKVIREISSNNLMLMSTDAGGYKSLMRLADKIKWKGEVYSANKHRTWAEGKSVLTQVIERESFGGKDILLIDDLCVYGGTFKGLSKILQRKDVGSLYLAVSHMTVSDLGNPPVMDYFQKVFTTNSKGFEYSPERPNLEIIKTFDI